MRKTRRFNPCPEMQAYSYLNKAGPGDGLKYEWRSGETGSGADLGTQKNVRIISIGVVCVWTVQPTPLQVHVTIDGKLETFSFTNPVSTTYYQPNPKPNQLSASQEMLAAANYDIYKSFFREGRQVKVEAEISGGTVSALRMIVVWAKW